MSTKSHLSDLLIRWEEARERGEDISAEELCRKTPELLDELRRQMAALSSMDRQIAPALTKPETVTEIPQGNSTIEYKEAPHQVGSRLDSVPGYEILGVLGRGGMGVVYKTRQMKLNRVVALKMIKAGAHAGDSDRRRFLSEAQAIARLQHPHIVQVHEVGEADGLPFFSLEFCPGGSLANKLAKSPLPPKEAAELVRTLAKAIHAAHEQGIIHRDLKPANVLLTDNGTPKVTDFGLAKMLEQEGQSVTGDVMGTPSYMAPEQAQGKIKQIGPAADIYALGAILYECLTGRPPFCAATTMDTLWQVIYQEPVSPRQLLPNLPRDLETVCLKCLHKEPAKRYESAAALAEDLGHFLRGEPIVARPVGSVERAWRWCKRKPALAAMSLVAVVGVVLALVTFGVAFFVVDAALEKEIIERGKARELAEKEKTANIRLNESFADLQRESEHREREALGRILQYRTSFYVTEYERARKRFEENDIDGARSILRALPPDLVGWEWHFLKHQCQRKCRTLFDQEKEQSGPIVFSPEGNQFVSARGNESTLFDTDTGQKRLSLDHSIEGLKSTVTYSVFSSNGAILASAISANKVFEVSKGVARSTMVGGIKIWDTATGKELKFLSTGVPVQDLVFTPNGKFLVSSSYWDDGITIWNLSTGNKVFYLKGHSQGIMCLALSRDGNRLVSAGRGGGKKIIIWDVTTGMKSITLQGRDERIVELAFSADCKYLLSASEDKIVRIWDVATGNVIKSWSSYEDLGFISVDSVIVSPNGSSLAVSGSRLGPMSQPLNATLLLDVITGDKRSEIRYEKRFTSMAFSQDGTRLAIASEDGRISVSVWDTRMNETRIMLREGRPVRRLTFSPDGAHLGTWSGPTCSVWNLKNLEGSYYLKGGASCVAFSPDGKLLATSTSRRGHGAEVAVWNAATRTLTHSLIGQQQGITSLAFSPDSKHLASASYDETVKMWNVATGKEVLTFKEHQNAVSRVAFSPDGKHVASASYDKTVKIWDANAGLVISSLPHEFEVLCLAFSPDGKHLGSVTGGNWAIDRKPRQIKVWNVANALELLCLEVKTGPVYSIAFSPDSKRLVCACHDGSLRIFDASSGQEILILTGHVGEARSVVFHPDGKRLASGGADGTTRIWDVATGQEVLSFKTHTSEVNNVAFSSDGKRLGSAGLASPGDDRLIQIRDADSSR